MTLIAKTDSGHFLCNEEQAHSHATFPMTSKALDFIMFKQIRKFSKCKELYIKEQELYPFKQEASKNKKLPQGESL
ncbi:hypothetical protein O9133_RS24595, partial [Escherichia coli]